MKNLDQWLEEQQTYRKDQKKMKNENENEEERNYIEM